MAEKNENDEKYKGTRRFVHIILTLLTLGIILLSGWYYSGMVAEYTGEAVFGISGSVYNDFTGSSGC